MAVILLFMASNIQIKNESALSRVQFTLKIALCSVHLILLYTHTYIFSRKKSYSLIFSRKYHVMLLK